MWISEVREGGRWGERSGSRVPTRAAVPRSTKYADKTRLTRSLGKNLNARKRERRMTEPMMGNFMASFLVMASEGGSGLTDRQQPQKTQADAVMTMLKLVGTGTKRGRMEMMKRAVWATGEGWA